MLAGLQERGFELIAPTQRDGAVTYGKVSGLEDLPAGLQDQQDGGRYRLVPGRPGALFDYVHGPHTWKQFLYPPEQRLWSGAREGPGFRILAQREETPRRAFVGVRACELRAMAIQDRVFDNGTFADPSYQERRSLAFVVAVNCTRAGGTCFCASMHADGPRATSGFDLALTEMLEGRRHEFLLECGSRRGAEVLASLSHRPATAKHIREAEDRVQAAAETMGREMIAGVAETLQANVEHPRWEVVAERCLSCGNCTSVCPTCFCHTVEDRTSLDGDRAERWRHWDSCFNLDFSYLHGGSIRRRVSARYRQWITHKLSTWWQQFGSSGCVGCGRCITWCPVGIDITEEARAIRDSETRG